MEKPKLELSLKENNRLAAKTEKSQEDPLALGTYCPKKIKPRAFILKSNNKDFEEIKELIETHFPEVEIIYVTTGPAGCTLRVFKSMPFETQNSSEQPLYTVE